MKMNMFAELYFYPYFLVYSLLKKINTKPERTSSIINFGFLGIILFQIYCWIDKLFNLHIKLEEHILVIFIIILLLAFINNQILFKKDRWKVYINKYKSIQLKNHLIRIGLFFGFLILLLLGFKQVI